MSTVCDACRLVSFWKLWKWTNQSAVNNPTETLAMFLLNVFVAFGAKFQRLQWLFISFFSVIKHATTAYSLTVA